MSRTLASLKDMLEKVIVMSLSNQHPPRVTNYPSLSGSVSVLALRITYLGTSPTAPTPSPRQTGTVDHPNLHSWLHCESLKYLVPRVSMLSTHFTF